MKYLRRTFAILLSLLLVFNLPMSVFAVIPGEDTASSYSFSDVQVKIEDNRIIERFDVMLNNQLIQFQSTTYFDDRVVLEIVENGVRYTRTYQGDYQALRYSLTKQKYTAPDYSINERYSGYSYRFMKHEIQTYYYTPNALTYAETCMDIAEALCGIYAFKAATVAAIAAAICTATYAPEETKIEISMNWFEETVDGQFVSYLCEYVAYTYFKINGTWVYQFSEPGDFNTLSM